MKKGRLQEIIKELQGASEMHLKQSKELGSHAEDMAKGSPAKQQGEYNLEDLLLDSDNPSSLGSGNRSDIQVDENGQYFTSLGDNESIPDVNNDYTRPTSNTNEINGIVTERDTIRPSKGNVFKSDLNKEDLKKALWVQGYH
jgi:hypothetical protein